VNSKARGWWEASLKKQGLRASEVDIVVQWLSRSNNRTAFVHFIDDKELRIVRAYVRCMVPNAEVDVAHFRNICPVCHYRNDNRWDHTDISFFSGGKSIPEYNQICNNCASFLPPQYLCTCPCCNSGLERPVSGTPEFKPFTEFFPRVYGVYQDLENFPPHPQLCNTEYENYNTPENRYVLVCPICLYSWSIVMYAEDDYENKSGLCPVCGSKMRKTKRRGKYGGVILECSKKSCNQGFIGVDGSESNTP